MKTSNEAATLSLASALALVIMFGAPVSHGLPIVPDHEPEVALDPETSLPEALHIDESGRTRRILIPSKYCREGS